MLALQELVEFSQKYRFNKVVNAREAEPEKLKIIEEAALGKEADYVEKMEELLPEDPQMREKTIRLFIDRNAA